LAVAGLTLVVSAPAAQAEPFDGEAFGVSASIESDGAPVAEVTTTPLATFPPGETASLASVEVGEPPLPLLVTGLAEVSSLLDDATSVLTSTASVADISLSADTPPVLEASVVTATCTAEGEDDIAADATTPTSPPSAPRSPSPVSRTRRSSCPASARSPSTGRAPRQTASRPVSRRRPSSST
jgi:hypothetical protein